MAKTPTVPEKDVPHKPEPEMKRPSKPQPEITYPPQPAKDITEKDDQADSGPDKDHPITGERRARLTPEDAHIGATEDQVSDRRPPAGEAFKDEPKQG
jgi:hypothetical protein